MKKKYFLFFLLLTANLSVAQQQTLQVSGPTLTTTSGQNVILRGINYPIIDDGNISLDNTAQFQHKIDQAALTGANAIRLQWYTDGTHWRDNPEYGTPGTINGYVNGGYLSALIGYCHTKNMIPILEIHNVTCSNDWTAFNTTVMNWWKSPSIIALINQHKSYLIVNLANEFGYARWTGDTASGLATFKLNYNAAIASLRALGVTVPIMVDAPDCGQSSTELLSIAPSMVTSDTAHNLIFSSHAYWSGYATSTADIQTKLNEAQTANVCFILGEVASTQDGDSCGSISLSSVYPTILQEACSRNIGWLAWTYSLDCSSGREMTTNGEYSTLTTYGNDLVNNPNYGLKSTSGCGATALGVPVFSELELLTIAPNPSVSYVGITAREAIQSVSIFDLSGRHLTTITSHFDKINTTSFSAGSYLFKIETFTHKIVTKRVLITEQ